MIFLIEYNRQEGRLINFTRFKNSDRSMAEKRRLELELDLNRKNIEHEIVILESASVSSLKRTHRRYFESLDKIVQSTGQ